MSTNAKAIKLNGRQKSALFFKSLGTLILLVALEIMLFFILLSVISNQSFDSLLQGGFMNIIGKRHLLEVVIVTSVLLIFVDFLIIYRVKINSINRYEKKYVIAEVQHIIDGDMSKTIDVTTNKDLQPLVNAINLLVTNANKLVNDERNIEKSKDELITNVSHDIRTPLTSIIGYLGLIESAKNLPREDVEKYTHIAYLKSQQMQELVNDLFEYTNATFKDSKLTITEFDMGQLLEQFAAEYELEAQKRGIEIDAVTPTDNLKMTGDPQKLSRVFNNLISNAFKYGTGAKHIWLTAEKQGEEVEVRVTNDGEMIPHESLNKLFERFYRVEQSRSKETGGTGLGLAIAQSIVNMHEGHIRVESNVEKTSFIVNLPMTQKQ